MAKKGPPRPGASPRYEDVRSRLEEVVAALEGGDRPLEETLALYEEGVSLVRAAHAILDAAEKRLEVLKPQPDGSARLEDATRAFETAAAGKAGGGDAAARSESGAGSSLPSGGRKDNLADESDDESGDESDDERREPAAGGGPEGGPR